MGKFGIGLCWVLVTAASAAPAPALEDPLAAALAGELALVDEDHKAAARAYAHAARSTRRVDFAERATHLALYAENASLAGQMAELWHDLAPEDRGAAQASALAQFRRGQTEAGTQILAQLLARGEEADYEAVIRTLSGLDADPGLTALRALAVDARFSRFTPTEISPVVLAAKWEDLKLARQLADASLKVHPRSARAWLWLALVDAAEGDKQAAARGYAQALKLDPGNVELRLSYIQVLHEAGRHAEVRKLLKNAPVSHPSLYTAAMALAVSNKDRREYQRLSRSIERDDSLDPSERSFLLGQLAELLDQPEDALDHYLATTSTPRRYDARLRMAVLEFEQRRERALGYLREIQDSGAEQAQQAFLLEAELFTTAGSPDQAILALSRGLSVYLDDTQLLYARALAYAGIDAVEQVETDLRRVIELEPENAAALNALGYTLTDRTQRHAEAYELIKQAYALNSTDAATLDSLGWVLFRLGRSAEALEYLQKAYSATPDPEIAAHLGEVLFSSGDRKGAFELWRKAYDPASPNGALKRTLERLAPELLK